MWSPCAGDALDPSLWKVPNKALSLSLPLSHGPRQFLIQLALSLSLSLSLSRMVPGASITGEKETLPNNKKIQKIGKKVEDTASGASIADEN